MDTHLEILQESNTEGNIDLLLDVGDPAAGDDDLLEGSNGQFRRFPSSQVKLNMLCILHRLWAWKKGEEHVTIT